jgi:alginate O-acetyltransferase complex protein AlgI
MVFNSASYFLFLPVLYLLFLAVPQRLRWMLLLGASLVFYGYWLRPLLLAALAAVILATYLIGGCLSQAELPAQRRRLLWTGVWANLSILVALKYLPFIAENLNGLLGLAASGLALPVPPILVSIGVSFYSFQAISYLADIYFRMARPEPHLGYLALYLCFFPKLLLGPIERAADLLPQLKRDFRFDPDALRSGLLLFAWGLFKKVAVADRMAQFVDPVYGQVHSFGGLSLLVAAYAYAIQLYCDFSGYTDMALGSARLFGIELTQNFNAPFLARSVVDFWRRWHISLSRWILDYIFEPLQMRFRDWDRRGTAAALLVTFVLAGAWHGASWTYVVFGAIHGVYLAAAALYKPYRKRVHRLLNLGDTPLLAAGQILATFHLVCIPWVFFRAASLADAWYVLGHLFSATRGLQSLLAPQGSYREVLYALLSTAVLVAVYVARRYLFKDGDFPGRPLWFKLAVYYGIIVLLALGRVSSGPQFIYLNF